MIYLYNINFYHFVFPITSFKSFVWVLLLQRMTSFLYLILIYWELGIYKAQCVLCVCVCMRIKSRVITSSELQTSSLKFSELLHLHGLIGFIDNVHYFCKTYWWNPTNTENFLLYQLSCVLPKTQLCLFPNQLMSFNAEFIKFNYVLDKLTKDEYKKSVIISKRSNLILMLVMDIP